MPSVLLNPAPGPETPVRHYTGWIVVGTIVLLVLTIGLAAVTFSVVGTITAATGRNHPAAPDRVLDGVTVHDTGQGWTFELESTQDCPAAKVVVGFSDTPTGESLDVLTDTAALQAGVPFRYTPESGASTHPYARIDEIVCHAM